MKRKSFSSPRLKRSLFWYVTVLTCAALVALVTAVVVFTNNQSLSSQLEKSRKDTAALQQQLATYQRTFCSAKQVKGKVTELTHFSVDIAGRARSYDVHIPKNYDQGVRYPVILSFDGINGTGERMRGYSHLDTIDAIVIYPNSLPGKKGYTAWQGAPYSLDGDYDIQFVKNILETLETSYCVDTDYIFAVGMSNGGGFATLVGCAFGDQIRGVVSISGAYYTDCKQVGRAPSFFIAHSIDDKQVPFDGSTVRKLPPVKKWVEDQAVHRACKDPQPVRTTEGAEYYDWRGCINDSTIELVVVKNQPHGWLQLPAPTAGDPSTSTTRAIEAFLLSTDPEREAENLSN